MGIAAATDSATFRDFGESAWAWVLAQVREDEGPWLPEEVPDGDGDPAAPLRHGT